MSPKITQPKRSTRSHGLSKPPLKADHPDLTRSTRRSNPLIISFNPISHLPPILHPSPTKPRRRRPKRQSRPFRTRSGAKPSRWTPIGMESRLCMIPAKHLAPGPIEPTRQQLERAETRTQAEIDLWFCAAKRDVLIEFGEAGRPDGYVIKNPKLVGFIVAELMVEPSRTGRGTPTPTPAQHRGTIGADTAYTLTF